MPVPVSPLHRPLRELELDEQLMQYWLRCRLPPEKRWEMEQHLAEIRSRRDQLLMTRRIPTNA